MLDSGQFATIAELAVHEGMPNSTFIVRQVWIAASL